jgi:hypothetical protein
MDNNVDEQNGSWLQSFYRCLPCFGTTSEEDEAAAVGLGAENSLSSATASTTALPSASTTASPEPTALPPASTTASPEPTALPPAPTHEPSESSDSESPYVDVGNLDYAATEHNTLPPASTTASPEPTALPPTPTNEPSESSDSITPTFPATPHNSFSSLVGADELPSSLGGADELFKLLELTELPELPELPEIPKDDVGTAVAGLNEIPVDSHVAPQEPLGGNGSMYDSLESLDGGIELVAVNPVMGLVGHAS